LKKTVLADSVPLFVTLVWGIMFVFIKEAIEIMEPLPHLAVRFSAAAVLNLLTAVSFEDIGEIFRPQIWMSLQVIRTIVIGAVFATAFAYWAQTYFQRYTTPAHTAIIFPSEPNWCSLPVPLSCWAGKVWRCRQLPAVC
jgi:drug/metabolite transporter (DMT)-like permease